MNFKENLVSWYVISRLKKLARTRSEEEFYQVFDRILGRLYFFARFHKQTGNALKNVRTAFRNRHPMTRLAPLLLRERLSETAWKKLARNFFIDWIINAKKRERLKEERFKAPWFFVVSPTYACNLHCAGCYAYEYPRSQGMSYQTLSRILREAKELGIRWLTISGGEPFYYKDKETGKTLLDLAEEHNDMYFQVYTNGTLLDERTIERLAKLGNIAPAISQEGFEKETDERRGKGTWQKICEARKRLFEAGVLQGFSITVTRQNAEIVSSDEFIDDLIERKVSFGWYFIYIPIGKEPAVELMPTPQQRDHLRRKVWEWRSTKPIFIGDFWNDGSWVGGCIAGGRKYFHINALGDIEPCVFVHFAVDNIYRLWKQGKGLREAITSPFFESIRRAQLGIDNWLCPCTIIDNPNILRDAVRKNNAYPTHIGAETIIQGRIAEYLDEYSRQVRALTRPEFERMKRGEYDTVNVKLSKVIENHQKRNQREYELMFGFGEK